MRRAIVSLPIVMTAALGCFPAGAQARSGATWPDFQACAYHISETWALRPQVSAIHDKAPPNLSRRDVSTAKLLSDRGGTKIYFYAAFTDLQAVCGLAVYGDAAALGDIEAIRASIAPAVVSQKERMYALDKVAGAVDRYWGDPLAPGLRGLMVRRRPADGTSPVLELDYHYIFIR